LDPFSNYWIFNDNTTISIQLKIYTDSFPLNNTTRHYKAEWHRKLNIRIDIVVVNFIDNCRNPNITGKHRTTSWHGVGDRTVLTAASSWPPSIRIWSRYISVDPILQSLWFLPWFSWYMVTADKDGTEPRFSIG
jgi:hypothetical protein